MVDYLKHWFGSRHLMTFLLTEILYICDNNCVVAKLGTASTGNFLSGKREKTDRERLCVTLPN